MKNAPTHIAAAQQNPAPSATPQIQPAGCPSNTFVPCKDKPARTAFTLIELLLAVAIFAIALLAIHGVFYSAIKLRNRTADALDASAPLEQALTFMKRDLANIIPPGSVLAGPLQTSPSTTDANFLGSALTAAAGVVGRQVSPKFYTTTGIISEQVPWGDIQCVAYFLVEPTNNAPGKDMVRVVWRNLLPLLSEQPETQWLMSGVQDVAFSFFDGIQWSSSWDSTIQEPPLPLAIKVQIELANQLYSPTSETEARIIELIVPLTVQVRTNQSNTDLPMTL